ncbi:hypothetical protein GCM10010503_36080 [Streptomyces lucensis JCM 4490]|uniref:Uncharacterized protein n=1 Tax=Streptomyces lucensis JCM 4490 TaxID=1306176 RepID=A0A918MSB4_9ACTN|nr:hypothetical protein [Streptomyces lucensis]GGW55767.1 hypothetical protein GCM10010503_36080 [Streptomyces lucensis JCM 4490]
MTDAAYAKLLWLEAKRVQDPDGADEITVSRGDGGVFERIRMRQGDVYEFDERFVPFVNQEPIDIVLHEVNEATGQASFIGGAGIVPSELGLGERTQGIGALSPSLYELTYKVL